MSFERWSAACIVLACVAGAVRAAPDEDARYEIPGFVVGLDDRPVPGATVSLEGTEIVAQTDSLGGFVLYDVPAGSYRVTARRGCVLSGYVDALHVPRPLKVPLPIRLVMVDCMADAELTDGDEADLIARSVDAFARTDRRAVVTALIGDGAIRLLDGGNVTIDAVTIGDAHPAVEHRSQDDTFEEAIWVSICLATPDAHTALVRMVRTSPHVAEELDVFAGNAALFTFTRNAPGDTWHLARQLLCADRMPEAKEPDAEETPDMDEAPDDPGGS